MQMWTNHFLLIVSPQIATSSPELILQKQVICNSFLETYSIKSVMKTERTEPLIFVWIYLIFQPIAQRFTHMIFIVSQIGNILKCIFVNLLKWTSSKSAYHCHINDIWMLGNKRFFINKEQHCMETWRDTFLKPRAQLWPLISIIFSLQLHWYYTHKREHFTAKVLFLISYHPLKILYM